MIDRTNIKANSTKAKSAKRSNTERALEDGSLAFDGKGSAALPTEVAGSEVALVLNPQVQDLAAELVSDATIAKDANPILKIIAARFNPCLFLRVALASPNTWYFVFHISYTIISRTWPLVLLHLPMFWLAMCNSLKHSHQEVTEKQISTDKRSYLERVVNFIRGLLQTKGIYMRTVSAIFAWQAVEALVPGIAAGDMNLITFSLVCALNATGCIGAARELDRKTVVPKTINRGNRMNYLGLNLVQSLIGNLVSPLAWICADVVYFLRGAEWHDYRLLLAILLFPTISLLTKYVFNSDSATIRQYMLLIGINSLTVAHAIATDGCLSIVIAVALLGTAAAMLGESLSAAQPIRAERRVCFAQVGAITMIVGLPVVVVGRYAGVSPMLAILGQLCIALSLKMIWLSFLTKRAGRRRLKVDWLSKSYA